MSGAFAGARGASKIVLVRHGQTDFNVQRRFQGIIDHPLNDHGREQARRAGEVLARRIASPSAQVGMNVGAAVSGVVRIICSPLSRAHETARILAAAFGAEGVKVGEPRVDERLIERCYGLFEGLTVDEAIARHEGEVAQWRATGESESAGVEASDRVGRRIMDAALDAAASAPEGATLVVVSHGAAISRGLVTFMGLNPLSFDALRGLDNCHWSELACVGGGGSGASGAPAWRLTSHNVGYREDVLGA